MAEEIKILHISSALTWRGGEAQIAHFIEATQDKWIDNAVCCIQGSPLHLYCEQQQINVVTYSKASSIQWEAPSTIRTFCKQFNPSIIHLHDSKAHTYAIVAATFFHVSVPFILSRKVVFNAKKRGLSAYKYNHPQIKKIICVSTFVKNKIADSIRDKSKLTVIHDGIPLEKFQQPKGSLREELGLGKDQLIIGYVAMFTEEKDHNTFIKAAKRIHQSNPNAQFVLIGDGPLFDQVKKQATDVGIASSCSFMGVRRDVPALLPDIDILLFTSAYEGLGSSVLEAFAAGIPVVSTDAGGLREIVLHEKTGIACKVGDVAALADGVERLIDDVGLRKGLIKNANEFVIKFSASAIAEKTIGVYKEILQLDL